MVVYTAQFAQHVSETHKIPYSQAFDIVSSVFSMITSELAKGNDIKSMHHFTLKIITLKPRKVFNINDPGSLLLTKPTKRVRFQPSIILKEQLNKI